MSGANNSSPKNSIRVQCERPSYYGGDVVRGAVYLDCNRDIDCTGIEIQVRAFAPTVAR